MSENTTSTQSIAPGSHAIAAAFALVGTGVDVLGKDVLVFLESGANGTGATVDVKIQESDDNITYTDWTGGGFTQVTEANDNATQEIQYTGTKQWIRTVSTVAADACSFGTSVVEFAPTSAEDALLTDYITTARQEVENDTRRALITQTWNYYLDAFPSGNAFKLPFGNLSATGLTITYTDSDGDDTIMTVDTDYIVEVNGDQCGRIVLPYGESWPSFTPYPSKPIKVQFTCGYGAAMAVPEVVKTEIKLLCSKYYESRGEDVIGQSVVKDDSYNRLMWKIPRLYEEF